MRAALALGIGLLTASGAAAQGRARMPAVGPAWTVTLPSAPDLVVLDAGHAVVAADGELRRVRLADGAVVASATLPDCDALHPAANGERFLVWDPIRAAGPNGLVVSCLGGTGVAPVRYVASIDPVSLAVRWRVDDASRHQAPIAERTGLVLIDSVGYLQSRLLTAVDAATGAVRWTTEVGRDEEPCSAYVQDDQTAFRVTCRRDVVAIDRATGRVRWRAPARELRLARLVPGRLVVASTRSVMALDVATGREVWRLDVPVQVSALEAIDAATLLVHAHRGDVLAVDAATGGERWRAAVAAQELLAHDRARVALEVDGALVVLDARTGVQTRRVPAGDLTAASWDGDALLALDAPSFSSTGERLGAHLRRFDLAATGAASDWRHARPIATTTAPLAHAGVVAVCSPAGVVHVLDRATGRARWRAFVGLADSTRGLPCELWSSEPDRVIVALGAGHTLSGFDTRAPVRVASARVWIKGEVVTSGDPAGVRVRVGDAWTRTDAEGHFEIAIRGTGMITLAVHPDDAQSRCASADPLTIPLEGAPRVRLRLLPDHCACHQCD